MALLPEGQLALAPPGEVLDCGPSSENRQYQHLLEVAASQESRLSQHAALRRNPGYDLSDPWLVDATGVGGQPQRRLVPGMPCQRVGTSEIVAYLGEEEAGSSCRVRLPSGRAEVCPGRQLLPLPTRPARQGDWALVVAMAGAEAELNGRRGLCGVAGSVLGEPARQGFWVMFEPSEPGAPPDMRLVAASNLVTLPTPPAGSARTPWEARRAVESGGRQPLKALADEGAAEAAAQQLQLAICEGGKEDDSGEESIELSGDDDGGSTDEAPGASGSGSGVLRVGSLVALPSSAGKRRHGRVERIDGEDEGVGSVTVRVLASGSSGGNVQHGLSAATLTSLTEDELGLSAVCSVCDQAEPEGELLVCERFGEECTGCAHLRCLQPPLRAVPDGDWFCSLCLPPARKRARADGTPAKAKTAASKKPTGGVDDTPAKATAKAKASEKPAAKAKAGPKAKSAKKKQ